MRGMKAKELRHAVYGNDKPQRTTEKDYSLKCTVKQIDTGRKDKDGKKIFMTLSKDTVYCTGDRKLYKQLKKEYYNDKKAG